METIEEFTLKVTCDKETANHLYDIKENNAYCYIYKFFGYIISVGIESIDDACFCFHKKVNNLTDAYTLYNKLIEYIISHQENMSGDDMRKMALNLNFMDLSE